MADPEVLSRTAGRPKLRTNAGPAARAGSASRAKPEVPRRGLGPDVPIPAPDPDALALLEALRPRATERGIVAAYEEELAGWTGGISCLAVTNRSAALHVAYAAAGVGHGDEVVVSALADSAVIAVVAVTGADVVLADVAEETAALDPAAVAAAMTRRTRAIVVSDEVGHPADYDALRAGTGEVAVIADSGRALGACYHGVPLGGLAELTAFAGPAGTGLVAIAEEAHLAAARAFRNPETAAPGLDYRLSPLLAALAHSRLRRRALDTATRTAQAGRYRTGLAEVAGLRLPAAHSWAIPAWSAYPVRVLDGRRREVMCRLRAAGIELPEPPEPAFRLVAAQGSAELAARFPFAARISAQRLLLPLGLTLSEPDQSHLTDLISATLT